MSAQPFDPDSLALSYIEEALPPIPELGKPESYYAARAKEARADGDVHGMHAFKVAQYITAAASEELSWEEKQRCYEHALRRHCEAPPLPADDVWLFYANLQQLVREHAAREAFRVVDRID